MFLVVVIVVLILYVAFTHDATILQTPAWWHNRRMRYTGYLCVFIASAGLVWYAWGARREPPARIHDEQAYLLQARIYAAGQLTAPAHPDPELFRQWHVFSTPRVAGKYFPGHSLALVPGILIRWPGFTPVVLSGLLAVVFVAIVSRLNGLPVALLSWGGWMAAVSCIGWHASYMSQTTSTAAWLCAWYAITRWTECRRGRWLAISAAAAAAVCATRPLSGLAVALPLSLLVILVWIRTQTRLKTAAEETVLALVCVLPAVLVIFVSNYSLTGKIHSSGWSRYTSEEIPYDRLGFGLAATVPPRSPNEDRLHRELEYLHRGHTISRLPQIALKRAEFVARGLWGNGRWVMGILAIAGFVAAGTVGRLFFLSSLLLGTFHLFYAQHPGWDVYSQEGKPALLYLSALGAITVAQWILRVTPSWKAAAATPDELRKLRNVTICFLLVCLVSAARWCASQVRHLTFESRGYFSAYAEAEKKLPGDKRLVFIRYSRNHNPHHALIQNGPWLDEEKTWRVWDKGQERNLTFTRRFPTRAAFLYDEETRTFLDLNTGKQVLHVADTGHSL